MSHHLPALSPPPHPAPIEGAGELGSGGWRDLDAAPAAPYPDGMGTSNARRLRMNRTDAERALWERLRRKQLEGLRFRQQVPLGRYVVDFLCAARRLIVEVDGGQHGLAIAADRKRTAWLEAGGFRVMRFWN